MKPISTVIHRADMMQPPVRQKPTTGLGDVVAALANPIAASVDKLTGSKLVGCQPCGQRKDRLNHLLPNILKPFSR